MINIYAQVTIILVSSIIYKYFQLFWYIDTFLLFNTAVFLGINLIWNIADDYININNLKKYYDRIICKMQSEISTHVDCIMDLSGEIKNLEDFHIGEKHYFSSSGKKFHGNYNCHSIIGTKCEFIMLNPELFGIL